MNYRPKKVLVIRFSSIGDIVLCSPIVRCIKQQWGSKVHFITKSKFRFVIKDSPYIDRIITVEDKVVEVKTILQEEQYDLVIDLHKNIRSQQVRAYTNGKYINFDKINIQKWLAVHTPIDILPKKHLVDRYFDSLSKLGLIYDGEGLDHFVGEEADADARNIVAHRHYAVLSLGATYSTKRIPLVKLKHFVDAAKIPIILIGGKDVNDLADQLSEYKSEKIANLVGRVSLAVSSAIVKKAEYVVTGDSGMMHIAAAHRVPLIVAWGSTHTSLGMYPFYPSKGDIPYKSLSLDLPCQPCSKIGKEKCPELHFKCMLNLAEEDIRDAVLFMEA